MSIILAPPKTEFTRRSLLEEHGCVGVSLNIAVFFLCEIYPLVTYANEAALTTHRLRQTQPLQAKSTGIARFGRPCSLLRQGSVICDDALFAEGTQAETLSLSIYLYTYIYVYSLHTEIVANSLQDCVCEYNTCSWQLLVAKAYGSAFSATQSK